MKMFTQSGNFTPGSESLQEKEDKLARQTVSRGEKSTKGQRYAYFSPLREERQTQPCHQIWLRRPNFFNEHDDSQSRLEHHLTRFSTSSTGNRSMILAMIHFTHLIFLFAKLAFSFSR